MSDLHIVFPTSAATMDELRPAIDAALATRFPGGMLKRRWDGDVLVLSGPGADGTIELHDGELVGAAVLRPPASLMKAIIVEKISAAMQAVVAEDYGEDGAENVGEDVAEDESE